MMNPFPKFPALLLVFFGFSLAATAQTTTIVPADPRFGAFAGGPDVIELGSLNVNWIIPLVHQKGRGIDFDYKLSFNSFYTPYPNTDNWGFSTGGGSGGYLTNKELPTYNCLGINGEVCIEWGAFVYVDASGISHPFSNAAYIYQIGSGPQTSAGFPTYSLDGSGIQLICPSCVTGGTYQPVVQLPSGVVVSNQQLSGDDPAPSAAFVQDNNGNYIYWIGEDYETSTTGTQTFTDTLGNSVLSTATTLANPNNNAWQGTGTIVKSYAAGSYSVVFSNNDVTSIAMPDGRSYKFNYGPTKILPGKNSGNLTSVNLPGGGTVTYSANTDGTSGFTRTVTDAIGNTSKWKYSQGSGSTTVTDPLGNQTVYGLGSLYTIFPQLEVTPGNPRTAPTSNYTASYTWTSKTVYSGLANAGVVLSAATQTWTYQNGGQYTVEVDNTVYGVNNSQKTSAVATVYNSTGQVIETDIYDYGVTNGAHGSLLGKTVTSYAAVGQILDHPQSVSQYDGQGNLLSETTYAYDEFAVTTSSTPTSSTPNHTTPTGSRGNLTSIYRYTNSSSSILSNASYYDTGLVGATSGAGSPTVTYTYGQCGNSYPTAVTETVSSSMSLATGTSWNCSTGLPVSQTDVNSNTTSYPAYDAFGRPTSIVDPAGNTTTLTYPTATSNTSTVSQAFVGSGVPSQYSQTSYDGLGRPILSQTRQGPTGTMYSSLSQIYDLDGRVTYTSIPYSATAGTYTTTGAGTSNTIDAAGRLLLSTDPGGGTTTYSYSVNDVSVTIGPAATGEYAKQRSLEYDGAGRLASVCEINFIGPGSCGQSTNYGGYLTKYTYQGSQVSKISQNAQANNTNPQVRTISYDLLGRATSQQMPETGTKSFVYDSDSSGVCPGSYSGSLIKTTDNAGNVQCMTYDGAGRLLSTQAVSGIYATLTPQTHYVYDAASLNGTAMQNVKGTVAEEYTCTGTCSTKLTDLFNTSYYETSGGQKTGRIVSQMWELTPHSSSYLTSQSISYSNGAAAAISDSVNGAAIQSPGITYGLDSFGRPSTVTNVPSNSLLVSGTTYSNLTNAVTGVTFGNGDSEAYGYDAATNRPTSFKSSITGSSPFSLTGGLTWNPNGALKNFTLTDGSDSSKNQNCNYAMDDLNRLASVNCAGSWAQSFSYDVFGNITKNPIANPQAGQITQTYAAGYSSATNQANSGVTAVYDLNGNQTLAESNMMTWNAAGQAIAVNGVVGTYDAAGRVVETGGSIAAVPAAVSTGTISLTGKEQSIPTYNTYQAKATVTFTGSLKSEVINPQVNAHPNGCGNVVVTSATTATCYDSGGGSVVVSINAVGSSIPSEPYTLGYGQPSDTATSIAAAFAAMVNANPPASFSNTQITATSSGGTATLTITQQSASPVTVSLTGGVSCNGAIFTPCSFAVAPPSGTITATQTGTTPTVYDSGTVTATISNLPVASYAYGGSDTPTTIASGLAAAINKADGGSVSAVSATVNSVATVQLSSKATGYGINWPVALSTTYNTNSFKAASFSGTTTNVAGGYNAVAAVSGSGAYTQFLYSPAGQKIAVVQNGLLVKGTVALPGGASAIYSSTALKYIRHKDWLGSSRLATTWAHGVYSKTAYAPFGESYNQAGTTDVSFTGEDQDTSAGVYDFEFRKYDPIAGRWMSPDPSGLLYADPTQPQSLNLYSYARNNPMVFIDPTGLGICYYGPAGQEATDDDESDWDFTSESAGDCAGNGSQPGGVYYDVSDSVTVNADGSGSNVEVESGLQSPDDTDFITTTTVTGWGPPAPSNCSVVIRCRALNIPVAGAAGLQHCSAVTTDSNGATTSESGGPVTSGPYKGKLGGWATTGSNITPDVYQGTIVYTGNSCQAASCMAGTAAAGQSDPGYWPNYNPYLGPNSNDWIKGVAGACGVSAPINTWGFKW